MSKIPFLLAAAFACPTLVMAQDNSDQIRATVAEMLADAETRTSLLSAGDAGHDGGFFLAGDGFKLSIGGNVQFRYMANFRDDRAGQDDFESG